MNTEQLLADAREHGGNIRWEQVVKALRARVEELEAALIAVYEDTSDLGLCPWLLGTGICASGCMDEPECQTCHPRVGWLTERHPIIADVLLRTAAESSAPDNEGARRE